MPFKTRVKTKSLFGEYQPTARGKSSFLFFKGTKIVEIKDV